MRKRRAIGVAALLFLVAFAYRAEADAGEVRDRSDVGRGYFETYCQVCHGADGKGEGPYANVLSPPPSDLTEIAKRRGGVFPETAIAEFIDGRRSPRAHGRTEMPIWGRALRGEGGATMGGETALRAQLYVLIEYLKTLQAGVPEPDDPPAQTANATLEDVGWHLYVRRCATCHGYGATGDGYLAPLLDPPPADLTRIAARRGAEFPVLEVAEWIDGRRGERAHGPSQMPVWGEKLGEFFPAAPGREAAIRGEIQLLVAFLRSIQDAEVAGDQ